VPFISTKELWISGDAVLMRNPWRKRQMREILSRLSPEKLAHTHEDIIRHPPPWSKKRDYLLGASEAQLKVMYKFGTLNKKLAEELKNEPKYVRLEKRLEKVREEMKNKTFGRKPRPKAPAIPAIEKMIKGEKPQTPKVTPASVVV